MRYEIDTPVETNLRVALAAADTVVLATGATVYVLCRCDGNEYLYTAVLATEAHKYVNEYNHYHVYDVVQSAA